MNRLDFLKFAAAFNPTEFKTLARSIGQTHGWGESMRRELTLSPSRQAVLNPVSQNILSKRVLGTPSAGISRNALIQASHTQIPIDPNRFLRIQNRSFKYQTKPSNIISHGIVAQPLGQQTGGAISAVPKQVPQNM
jgi:hypothetical protein